MNLSAATSPLTRIETYPSRRIVLLAYEHMNLLDLAGPLQALATVNRRRVGEGPPHYEIVVASADGGLVSTGSGLPIQTVPIAILDGVAIDTIIKTAPAIDLLRKPLTTTYIHTRHGGPLDSHDCTRS